MADITRIFKEHKIIAMIKEVGLSSAAQLGKALLNGGVRVVNISQFSREGSAILNLFTKDFPELICGGGNVQSVEAASDAIKNGAKFIFSPLFDQQIVDMCRSANIPVFPVITDPFLAIENGLKTISLYPVERLGGARFAQSLFDRFGLTSIVAGGISKDTISSYLKTPAIIAATGAWMIDPSKIDQCDFDGVADDCRALLGTVH
ncbi:MAG: hypothetical protein ACPKOP_01640 [Sphaerochaetaceae bacterium]